MEDNTEDQSAWEHVGKIKPRATWQRHWGIGAPVYVCVGVGVKHGSRDLEMET